MTIKLEAGKYYKRRDKLCAMVERKFLEQGINTLSEDTVVTRDNTKDI